MASPSILVRVLGDLQGLAKSFTDAGSQSSSAASKMHDAFSGVLNTLNRTGVLGPFGEALGAIDEGLDQVARHARDIGPAMMGVGAALVGVGVGLQVLGSRDQAAHQQLQAAVEATGKSYEDYAAQVEEAIKTQERFGTAANTTQDALRILTTATNDPAKALDLLNTAANLAAARHESLSQAATDLARAYGGNARIFKLFGIQLQTNADGTKNTTAALDQLSAKLTGQASAAANTFSGHLAAIKAHLEDVAAEFGQKYGPAVTAAGAALTGLGAALEISSAAIEAARAAALGTRIELLALSAASKVTAAATWLLNIALDANPIVLIVLAIAGLIAALVLLATHVTAVRDFFIAAWRDILAVVQMVWRWIQQYWPLLLGILLGPIALAAALIYMYWNQILAGLQAVWRWIAGAWGSVYGWIVTPFVNAVNAVVSFFAGLPGRILGILAALPGQMFSLGVQIVQGLINGIGSLAGAVTDKIKSVVEAPINAAKGLLGIHSPSSVFAEMGRNTIAGYLQGIDQLAGAVTPAVSAALPTAAAAGPVAAGPAVVINDAHFSTELDIESFMRRAAWAVQAARV